MAQDRSAIWSALFADGAHTMEYKAVIAGVEYGMDRIIDNNHTDAPAVSRALFTETLSIGKVSAATLSITIDPQGTIPRMASVLLYARLVSGEGLTASEWMPQGAFYIDTRDEDPYGWLSLECYDGILKLEQTFIDAELESGEWPITMAAAVSEICARAGLTLDSQTVISTGADYVVAYPNDLTMREVLGYIGAAHGGSWTITPANKLRLVVLETPKAAADITVDGACVNFSSAPAITISRVTLTDDAGNSFTAGDDTGYELDADCPYATQSLADHLGSAAGGALYGVSYLPYKAATAYIDPAHELGDSVLVNGSLSVIVTSDLSAGAAYTSDISAPANQEVDHEYPYLSKIERAQERTVKQNTAYYGASISRADGIKIARSDGASEAQFNSDVFAMRALVEGVRQDKIYFDQAKGTYMFDGELSADVVNALSALITPNLYAGKATISELTVDQLDTSTKVQNYLNEDTSDVNYIKIYNQYIEFITASTDGSTAEQVTNRDGQPLYWMDDTHATAATEETDYPVMVYTYTEMVKMRFAFEFSDSAYNSKIQLGAGDGVLPDSAKGEIFKGASGIEINYNVSNTGDQVQLALTDDKTIKAQGNTGTGLGVRNFAFGTTAPESPQFGDFWVNTGG